MNIALNAAATLSLLVACTDASFAHDQWQDGEPVPAWVKQQCCGVSDIHHLRPEQVHVTEGGYRLDGYNAVVPESQLSPSPDGDWWVFYRNYGDGTQSSVYCFFGPLQGS